MEYVFKCENCKKQFSIIAPIGTLADDMKICPDCKSLNVFRKWFSPGIVYKGTGFTKKIEEEK